MAVTPMGGGRRWAVQGPTCVSWGGWVVGGGGVVPDNSRDHGATEHVAIEVLPYCPPDPVLHALPLCRHVGISNAVVLGILNALYFFGHLSVKNPSTDGQRFSCAAGTLQGGRATSYTCPTRVAGRRAEIGQHGWRGRLTLRGGQLTLRGPSGPGAPNAIRLWPKRLTALQGVDVAGGLRRCALEQIAPEHGSRR